MAVAVAMGENNDGMLSVCGEGVDDRPVRFAAWFSASNPPHLPAPRVRHVFKLVAVAGGRYDCCSDKWRSITVHNTEATPFTLTKT
jgi:hypothetical protein